MTLENAITYAILGFGALYLLGKTSSQPGGVSPSPPPADIPPIQEPIYEYPTQEEVTPEPTYTPEPAYIPPVIAYTPPEPTYIPFTCSYVKITSTNWSGPYTALDPYIGKPYYNELKAYYGSLPALDRGQAQEAIWHFVIPRECAMQEEHHVYYPDTNGNGNGGAVEAILEPGKVWPDDGEEPLIEEWPEDETPPDEPSDLWPSTIPDLYPENYEEDPGFDEPYYSPYDWPD